MKLPSSPRVLFVTPPPPGPYEYIFARFSDGFRRLGFPIRELDPYATSGPCFRSTCEEFAPDVIFCALYRAESIRLVAKLLAEYHPTVALNWFQEDPNCLCQQILEDSKYFDFWFTQDPKTVPFWKTKAFFSPHAFDESNYWDRRLPRVWDVSFVGGLGHARSTAMYWPYMNVLSHHGKRAFISLERPIGIPLLPPLGERIIRSGRIRRLLQALPLWPCVWKNPRNETEKAEAISRSKIHFCLSRVVGNWEEGLKRLLPSYPLDEHGLFYQCKGRLFHATGTNTLALVDYYPELGELFAPGKEIVTYRFNDFSDLKEKIAWYLAHDHERLKIASAGYERAHKHHTFTARIQQIMHTLRTQC